MSTESTEPAGEERRWKPSVIWLVVLLAVLTVGLFLAMRSRRTPATSLPAVEMTGLLYEFAGLSQEIAETDARLIEMRADPASSPDEARALELALADKRQAAAALWNEIGAGLELTNPSDGLVKFSSQPVQRWNYRQIYHPVEGPQPNKMPAGFSHEFDYIVPTPTGAVIQKLDARGGSAIKWELEKMRARTQGHYTVEATIHSIKPGVVYAPLWLYSEPPAEPGHEFDFELIGNRLEYNLHNGRGGFRMREVNKDLEGHKVRYEIIRRPGRVTMRVASLTDGWTDELVITPERVAQWAQRDGAPERLVLPPDNVPMFPVTELWRCRTPEWCGAWQSLSPNSTVDMTIHGYRFDP